MPFDDQLAQRLTRPFLLRMWMLRRLPMGLLSGMVIASLDQKRCVVMLQDRWWIRNPFQSVFWAVMSMAAEMSTGALVYAYTQKAGIQFILVGMEGKFHKKTRGKSFYFCESGMDVLRSCELISKTMESTMVALPVQARDNAGELLAEFVFTWQLRKPIV